MKRTSAAWPRRSWGCRTHTSWTRHRWHRDTLMTCHLPTNNLLVSGCNMSYQQPQNNFEFLAIAAGQWVQHELSTASEWLWVSCYSFTTASFYFASYYSVLLDFHRICKQIEHLLLMFFWTLGLSNLNSFCFMNPSVHFWIRIQKTEALPIMYGFRGFITQLEEKQQKKNWTLWFYRIYFPFFKIKFQSWPFLFS